MSDGPMLGVGRRRQAARPASLPVGSLYLNERGIPGNSILSITFTNKAAGEMKQRIAASSPQKDSRLGPPRSTLANRLHVSLTLSADSQALCRAHWLASTNFSVSISARDQHKLVKEAFKALENRNDFNFTPATNSTATISNAKNRLT